MDLKGKTALVTGGAVRIGRAICELLADAGCNVVVHYNRSSREAVELVKGLRERHVQAFACQADISVANNCRKLMNSACKAAGNLDILVNNAAVFHKDSLISATDDKFTAEMSVNFMAPAVLSSEFSKRLLRRCVGVGVRGGIVNLLDRRIVSSEAGCLPYLLSKKMLAELTRNSALELAPDITVNAVAPGAILRPPAGRRMAVARDLAGEIPMKKRCSPEDVARAVMFLLQSDGITGQIIFVDGGQHLLGCGV